MSNENWIAPEELRAIADYCEALTPLWNALTTEPKAGVSVDCQAIEVAVYDSNGDRLGRITWGDDGPAFYTPTTEPETTEEHADD